MSSSLRILPRPATSAEAVRELQQLRIHGVNQALPSASPYLAVPSLDQYVELCEAVGHSRVPLFGLGTRVKQYISSGIDSVRIGIHITACCTNDLQAFCGSGLTAIIPMHLAACATCLDGRHSMCFSLNMARATGQRCRSVVFLFI